VSSAEKWSTSLADFKNRTQPPFPLNLDFGDRNATNLKN
jgi:hypothetical protein